MAIKRQRAGQKVVPAFKKKFALKLGKEALDEEEEKVSLPEPVVNQTKEPPAPIEP
jgi:hypothetical protein